MKFLLRWLERALLLVAVFCLGAWAWVWLAAKYTQARDSQILDDARSSAPAPPARETDRLDTFQPSAGKPETPPRPWRAEGSSPPSSSKA
jgi:hypothetical protein